MPLDRALPPSRLPPYPTSEEITRYFPAAYGVRVDVEALPAAERLRLAGVRLPEPPEANLLDRVLQHMPSPLASTASRIMIIDNGVVGQLGSYRDGIVRLYTPVLRLGLPDPDFAGRFSLFTTTVVHELAHAIYAAQLTPDQRAEIVDLYLDDFAASERREHAEPTDLAAEHYFVALFMASTLRFGRAPMQARQVRVLIDALGLRPP